MSEPTQLPDNVLEIVRNAHTSGLDAVLGLKITSVTLTEIEAELEVGPQHLQPYGLVHGGVYASIVETLGSVGAAVNAAMNGRNAVGLENSTSFLRGVREGTLKARAVPLSRGRRTQVWEVTICGDDGKVAATGRLRALCVEAAKPVAGQKLT